VTGGPNGKVAIVAGGGCRLGATRTLRSPLAKSHAERSGRASRWQSPQSLASLFDNTEIDVLAGFDVGLQKTEIPLDIIRPLQ
jgi:hypothetical protein